MAGKKAEYRHTYEIKSKYLSSKRWIENEMGETAFYHEGGNLLDAQRNIIYKLYSKFVLIGETIYIKQTDGNLAATIKKGGLLRLSLSDWNIEIPDAPEMTVNGSSYWGVKFAIESNGKRIANVWDAGIIREIYTVEVEPEQDDALILAIASLLAPKYKLEGVMNREDERAWKNNRNEI